jgi:peptidoglycan hydrolase-like protein with peptidoglycan-binding domain
MMQLDYYSGQIDTNYDAGLQQAVQAYQKAHRIGPTGTLGDVTRVKLLREYLNPKTILHFRPYDLISRGDVAKVVYLAKHNTQLILGVSTTRPQQELSHSRLSYWFSLVVRALHIG